MRLDFNVLWVDDQPKSVADAIPLIAPQMEDQGFLFNPTVCSSMADVDKFVNENVFIDEIDLILVDWDLGGGVHGQDAIASVREKLLFKDIIFYSGQTAPRALQELAFQNELEGIYCTSRDGLPDEVIGVFESLIKKVLDLDHTRGIVMGATSDIDFMVNECLVHIHGGLDEAGQKQMLDEALAHIAEKIKKFGEDAAKLQGATSMATLFEAHMIFTAYDRLRFLSRALKGEKWKEHAPARDAVVKYMGKVVPDRNLLGHAILLPQGKPQLVVDGAGKQVTLDEMRDLRRLILSLRSEFRTLLDRLRPQA